MAARYLIGGSLAGSGESIFCATAGRVGPSFKLTPFSSCLMAMSLIEPST